MLSFHCVKLEVETDDGEVAVWMNCQKSVVFKGEEYI